MAAMAAPRRSLGVEASRSPLAATQNTSGSKTFKKMFQDTLRVTGLTRQRGRETPTAERPPIPQQAAADKTKDKTKVKEHTQRNIRVPFARKPKLPVSSKQDKPDFREGDNPFMGSLRQASLSSPVLPQFTNPFTLPDDSPAACSSATALVTPTRPRIYTRRSSTSKDEEREPASPLRISRPRPLVPTSPSAAVLTNNAANAARSVSPSPHRNRSPPLRMTRFPSISTSNIPSSNSNRAISPTFHSHNTSTTSLNTSSPYRESIRTASSLLIKHLSRPPPPLRQNEWQDVELRLRALSRLERIWGKSGGASSVTAVGSGSGLGGGEERERRLFCETVRDGYVLCALLNKFRPGTIERLDPKEDGFTKTSNVTKFLAGALNYGVSNSDLFRRDDLLEATSESLGRVARTIIALVQLNEPAPPSASGPKGFYMSVRGGIMSSPNLVDSRSFSPTGRPSQKERYSPPSALPPILGSKPSVPADAAARKTRATSLSNPVREPSADATVRPSSPSAPLPPPRSPLRPNLVARSSITSSITDTTTLFSLSEARTSTRFGTVRTVATKASSIHPDSIFTTRPHQDTKPVSQELSTDQQPTYQTQFTEIPTTSRRKSYDRDAAAARLSLAISQAPMIEFNGPTRPWRERHSSDLPPPDLSNVEEVDEYGTRRGRPPPDSVADQSTLNPDATPSISPQRVSFDRPRPSFDKSRESPLQTEVDLSTTPPKPKAGLPVRRPMHGHRHSVDTVAQSSMLLPVPRHSSLTREKQSSPSSSRESSTPSPPTGANRVPLAPRKSSSRPSPRASYVPKLNGVDDARVSSSYRHRGESDQIETTSPVPGLPRVPFPRSTSGDFANTSATETSRLAPLHASSDDTHTRKETGPTGSSNGTSGDTYRRGAHPGLTRGRYNSELDTTGTRKPRPNSLDDGGVRPGRSRFESMMNLGSSGDVLSRESSISVNAIRQPLIVREEGKQPMHYQIGNGIGRGQFGAVYRALNLNTGQMVAVKRIGLQGLSEDEISNLMKEVDVLKRLSHPSIVKYEGMVRSTDALSIVLEYVENGSLGQTIKAFGKLNERLVATYITKILEGLNYLHNSHVVHCDLKAANILTTKTGNVKLSDFGVSLNLHAKALDEIKNDVAGTPNWMAPEVIQLQGPSPASDIWSLGCTAIELLTGHPPYHEIHNGLSVMFRIVEDDLPPIPPECSPQMEDFLKQCFKKDPKERPDAVTLFEHPWLKTAWAEHRELRPQDSIPFLRRVSVELAKSDASRSLSVDTRNLPKSESPQDAGDLRARAAATTPLSPLSPLSVESAEGPARQHSFIKTTFGRAVQCRVCHDSVKRSAVLCEECGLIAHARCAADAPASCDIRAQLLLYSQYSQASTSQELSTPTRETVSPAASTTPILIPGSPRHRTRRDSDATFSSSPRFSERILGGWRRSSKSTEPLSPPTSPPAVALSSSPSYYPLREETPTPTTASHSAVSPSSPRRPEKMRRPSRLSFQSAANTDSMRSMVTAVETVSSSTPSYSSTPRSSAPHGATRQPRPILTNPITTNTHPAANESSNAESRQLNTRMSTVSTAASEFGEERNRIRRSRRDSISSKESQCTIQ